MSMPSLFAVTGDPVLHSKSPLMFNAVLESEGVYCRLAAHSAEEAVFLFKELGLRGMNVTAPFKRDIMDHLDEVEDAAITIGGVNTVVALDHGLAGYNTDHIGVTESFKRFGIQLRGNRCIVLGAGGAGRAAAYGLLKEDVAVTVINRTYEKAVAVARSLGCGVEKIEFLRDRLQTADILVSTLAADIDIIPAQWLSEGLVVFDANYKRSALSQKAMDQGCLLIKGEEWLLNQALPAYGHFLGASPTPGVIEKMRQALQGPPPAKPRNVALIGFMGSGKSSVGKTLAQLMGWAFRDLDQLLEEQEGRTIPEIFKTSGEAYFRAKEKALLEQELANNTGMVYALGGGAAIDPANREVLKRHALTIWLYTRVETIVSRMPRGTRPLLDCENPVQRAREILTGRLNDYAAASDLMVNSETGIRQTAEKIHAEIGNAF